MFPVVSLALSPQQTFYSYCSSDFSLLDSLDGPWTWSILCPYYALTGTVDGPCYWHLPSVFRCYSTEPWLSFSALPGLDPSCCESPLLEAVCPHYGLTWIASCSWPGDKKQLLPWIHQHHVFLLLSVSEVHCFSGLDLLIQSDFATCP